MTKAKKKASPASRFAYSGLDRVIHERARLGVLTCLITHPKGLPFPEMKRHCALTDGNLNRHLQVLQEALLISITKGLDSKRLQAYYRITTLGRRRYTEYLAVLEQVIRDGERGMEPDSAETYS